MLIKQYRKQKGLTQEALAEQVGINYRSLQDYEQGHKKLSSANGDTLLRLATALGCSIEELLMQEVSTMHSTRMRKESTISSTAIHNQIIHCPKYKLHGKFICCNDRIAILFYYTLLNSISVSSFCHFKHLYLFYNNPQVLSTTNL